MHAIRLGAYALLGAAMLTAGVNAVLTPALPAGAPFAEVAASEVFRWRQALSALAALLLAVGVIGLGARAVALAPDGSSGGRLAADVARALAFVGSTCLLAHEWAQVFVVHAVARATPEALTTLEAAPGVDAFDLGAMIAVILFTVGWLALASALLRKDAGVGRFGPGAIIAGFFAVPLLSALLSPVWGGAIGNGVLAAGWFSLGVDLLRSKAA